MASFTSQHGGLVICLQARCSFNSNEQMAPEMLLASVLQTSCLHFVLKFANRFE